LTAWRVLSSDPWEVIVDLSFLRHVSLFTKFGLIVSLTPLIAGIVYAIRPNERRLALMRPLSLAGIFAAVSSLLLGMANALEAIARNGADATAGFRPAATMLAEAMIPSFVGFACLTVAWLCVAAAVRRAV
jgi:predicted small integral membrane protein